MIHIHNVKFILSLILTYMTYITLQMVIYEYTQYSIPNTQYPILKTLKYSIPNTQNTFILLLCNYCMLTFEVSLKLPKSCPQQKVKPGEKP